MVCWYGIGMGAGLGPGAVEVGVPVPNGMGAVPGKPGVVVVTWASALVGSPASFFFFDLKTINPTTKRRTIIIIDISAR